VRDDEIEFALNLVAGRQEARSDKFQVGQLELCAAGFRDRDSALRTVDTDELGVPSVVSERQEVGAVSAPELENPVAVQRGSWSAVQQGSER